MAKRDALTQSLRQLAGASPREGLGEPARDAIRSFVADSELPDGDDVVPDWLMDMLQTITGRRTTDGWIPFTLRGLDDSDVLDLVRNLHQALPVEVEDNEESWLLRSSKLGAEAAISFERPAYNVSRLGQTWGNTGAR